MVLGFIAVGGFSNFFQANADRLHMILPANHVEIPWTALIIGIWIPNFYYWGLNQYIMQRTLGAKSLRQGQMGVVLADIGGGTADIAIFIEGSIWHTAVLPTGGEHITNDIAIGLRTPFTTAEELKIKYGHAMPTSLATDELIEVTSFGNGARQEVSRLQLAEVLEARAEEILSLVLREVKRSGYDGLLAAGLVVCGGSAELTGLRALGEQVLRLPVRVGTPQDLQGLTDVLESPAYATPVGLLLWGMQQEVEPEPRRKRPPNLFMQRVRDWFRAFLPG